ncbi:MAG: hypothetical protein ACRDRR_24555 [Pseudonocardiaceae bacterium]
MPLLLIDQPLCQVFGGIASNARRERVIQREDDQALRRWTGFDTAALAAEAWFIVLF